MKNCYEEYSSGRISKTTGFILAKLSLAYRQACYEMLWRIRSDREWEFLNHPESILFRPHKIPSENMWLWAKSPRMVPQNHWFMDVYFPSHIFIGNLTHPECTYRWRAARSARRNWSITDNLRRLRRFLIRPLQIPTSNCHELPIFVAKSMVWEGVHQVFGYVCEIFESKNVVESIGTQDRTGQYRSHSEPHADMIRYASLGIPWHSEVTTITIKAKLSV